MCVLSLHHKLDEVGNQVCNRFSTVLIVDIFWCGNYTMSEVSDKLYSICEIYYSLDICLNFTSPSNGWSAVTFLVVAMRKCFWFLHLTPSLCSRDLLSPPSPHVRNVIICFIWSRYSQDHPVSDDSHDLLLSSHSLSMIQTRGKQSAGKPNTKFKPLARNSSCLRGSIMRIILVSSRYLCSMLLISFNLVYWCL